MTKSKARIELSDHFSYRRLLRFALPSVAMMLFTSVYGVVDGFFVSNFAGKTPFAAVNLIMPFLMILSTVGFMFGTGGSALVAKAFGEGDAPRANRYFSLFIYVSLALGVLLALLGIIFMPSIAVFLGATGEMLANCVTYGRIILLALPFFILQLELQSFFVTAEKPELGLGITVASGVTNMVLDAVLVLLLPQPYKLVGAAVATAMSQTVGGLLPMCYFFSKNNSLLQLGKTVFDGGAILKAVTNGSSEFMSNISMSLVGIFYNFQLMRYAGENGVAAYGVMMYVSFMFAALFIGYSVGTAPLFGYHHGAENHAELKGLLKKSLVMVLAPSVVMTVVGVLFSAPLSAFFVGYDKELFALTVRGFRFFSVSFLFMGLAIFSSGFFTALGDGLTSALISFLRTLVFQTAAVWLLPLIFELDGVWLSIIAAEGMAASLSAFFILYKRRTFRY